MSVTGVDVGTNRLVAATLDEEGKAVFKSERDAFYRIVPKSEVNKNAIRISLEKRGSNFIVEGDNFCVLGEDALQIALDRNDASMRPMQKGIISPKDKANIPILKLLLQTLIGEGNGERLVYSVPSSPIEEHFDIEYHSTLLNMFFEECGFKPSPINESFAIGLNELIEEGVTGITVSCLVSGTKIYTNNGIVNIEDVKVGDEVLTHKGRLRKITKVIKKQFSGLCTKLQLQGYLNNTDMYKFVDNHEVYVNKNGEWLWVGCEDLNVGDIVGEPIINRDLTKNSHTITLCEHTTCSKKYVKNSYRCSPNVLRLIGYFLGDGSIIERSSGIQFDFGLDEKENINDVQEILKKVFKKDSSIYQKDNKCIRVKCYSKGLASWFRNNCYDKKLEKILPFDLSRLKKSECLSLLIGLIRSDGNISEDIISFYNTSTNLIMLCKQLFSRLGIASSISFRKPRKHTLSSGRMIEGKKDEWVVSTGKKEAFTSLFDAINSINCDNSTYNERLFIMDDFCCSRIQAIENESYEGVVYDLQVDEDHSFSGPYLTIHNCGAGMANIAVIAQGDPVITFATTRSGDFIDRQVGLALDMSPSLVQLEKEAGVDLLKPSSKILEAVSIYYRTVINYTVDNIVYELKNKKGHLPVFREEVPVVLSGGLAWAKGFDALFADALKKADLPFNVGDIRIVENPDHCVAAGCLLAAQL